MEAATPDVKEPNALLRSCGVDTTDADSVLEGGDAVTVPLRATNERAARADLSRDSKGTRICRMCGKRFKAAESAAKDEFSSEVESRYN